MNTFINSDEKLSKYMLRKIPDYWGLRTPALPEIDSQDNSRIDDDYGHESTARNENN